MRPIEGIAFHHSASSLATTMRDLHQWHVVENGWSAIGYHHIVLGDGTIRAVRHPRRSGAHVLGKNSVLIGICIVGDNTVPGSGWTFEQITSGQSLLNAYRLIIPGIEFKGHRDWARGTECPGLDVKEVFR